ncbi:hypothetical protein G7Z17_g788 [Cylindrodendrum hubeiense]|uniref:Uncharacterized protein n=1 Tax=Cylindrodendrum hubeiense TaxID=595255 RepID=A0A9P5LKP1_9HYPO|nr:hypothetical protein G7Z17_g788 [Cylindrodendrum hubeiense]
MSVSSGSPEKQRHATGPSNLVGKDNATMQKSSSGFWRIFTYGRPIHYLLEFIGIIAAIGSGVAMVMVNVVLGQFITLLDDASTTGIISDKFMSSARRSAHSYLRAAFSQEIGFFDQGVSGSISMQATSNGKLIQSGISEKLGVFVQAVASFAAAFIIAFITNWKLTLIIICIVPALLIVVGGVAVLDGQIEMKILKTYGQAGSYAEHILGGIRTIHAFSLRPRVIAKYDTFLQDAYNLGMKKNLLYGVMFGGEYFIVYSGMGLAFWQGVNMISRGEIPNVGVVFTVLFSVIVAASTVMNIAPHMVAFGRAASAASEMFRLIDRTSEINPFENSGEKPEKSDGIIDLKAVDFSYPTRPDVHVLESFSLHVPAGKVTAFVWFWQKYYCWTPRTVEPVIFNGSVFENVVNGLVGTPWETSTPEEQMNLVEDAAKLAFAHDFIIELPQGYQTRIGERGGLLSGGQKQRIAIARSIISRPKILLLDEATSALDPHAEGIVQQALDSASQNRTTIVIAHKLATIRHADNIVVFSKGKITEQGRHDDLVARNGVYSTLVKAQDLSPSGAQGDLETSPGSESETSYKVEQSQSLAIIGTAEERTLASLRDREDHGLYEKSGIIRTIYRLLRSTPELRFCKNLRKKLLDSILRQDLRFFDRPENTVGAINSRLDSYPQAVFELMGFNVALVFLSALNVLSSAVLSLAVSWKLGAVGVFAGLPPMLLAGHARIRLETKMDHDMDKRFSTSSSVASESIMAIRTVSSLAIEGTVLKKYTDELDKAIREGTTPLFSMMIGFSLTQCIEYFILALGFWWGSKLISQGEITFYQFMVSFMGVYFCGQATGQMFSFVSSFTKACQAANYFFWLDELEPTIRETEDNSEKGPKDDCKTIGLESVQFSYPLAPDNRVLKGISLQIKSGEFVAFVGGSGCGKSTMISLLERFYDPTSGTISIDGSDSLASINPLLYRNHLALVQQEPTLFPGSIRENISQGVDMGITEMISDSKIEDACRAANIWEFIASLPEGLATPCGTSGSQLSGGQRQRIAIARALIRNPKVILLDEATSALDTESERIVQAALAEAATAEDRITIAVAHRLSTVRNASRIFVFYGGRIVEAGTHRELIEQGGMYAKMCEAQKLDSST